MHRSQYKIIRPLGRGGMAEVFLAEALGGVDGFGRPVVIKKILERHTQDPAIRRLFVDEAKLATRLQHGNIIQVLDLFDQQGQVHMVMEYVRGRDLLQIMRKASQCGRIPFSPPDAVHIVVELLRGLDHAHEQGLVHRDVSPPNVLVSFEGQVKLGDFGIAVASASLGLGFGKPGYMAPEQLEQRPVDHRCDIFSTGIILYEMLAGRRLFRGSLTPEGRQRLLQAVVQPLGEVRPDLPPSLVQAVHRSLAREPEARFALAAEMEEELLRAAVLARIKPSAQGLAKLLAQLFPQEVALEHKALDDKPQGPQPGTPAFAAQREMVLAEALGWGDLDAVDWRGWELGPGQSLLPLVDVDLEATSWGSMLDDDDDEPS